MKIIEFTFGNKVKLFQHILELKSLTYNKNILEDCSKKLLNLKELMDHIVFAIQKFPVDFFPTFVFESSIHA